ncbi:hypothetical protein PV05_01084 [Exophiala xenobiotica]|uniref:Uncharacterized protein n=1 Tax=Exophiala xenobiotica TaxID=348802 RepID=A0A0D2EYU0_9EURO|nr:uncharacterized protein PV05_01084 [Exophiala xenobiotica]KIW60903.1 hypothetical protein PV05_01084 [Exophiala xenobiotica]
MPRVDIPPNHPFRTGAFAKEQRGKQREQAETCSGWTFSAGEYNDELSNERLKINKKEAEADLNTILATASKKPGPRSQLNTPPRTPLEITEPRDTPPDWSPPPDLPVIESFVRGEFDHKRIFPYGRHPEPKSVFPVRKPTKSQISREQGLLFQALGPPAARPLNLEAVEGRLRGLPYPLNNFVFVKENVKSLFDKVLDEFNSNPGPIDKLLDKCQELARAIIDEVRLVDEDYVVVHRWVEACVELHMHGPESSARAILIARTTREELKEAYDVAMMGIVIEGRKGVGKVAKRPCAHPRYRRALAMARAAKREEEMYQATPVSASLPELA